MSPPKENFFDADLIPFSQLLSGDPKKNILICSWCPYCQVRKTRKVTGYNVPSFYALWCFSHARVYYLCCTPYIYNTIHYNTLESMAHIGGEENSLPRGKG